VSILSRLVLFVTRLGPVRYLFTRFRVGRRMAMRFVAGESLEDAVAAVRRLNAVGCPVSLDHLGEHVTDRELAERARDDYLQCLERIASEGLDANISIKLTQLGLGFDDALAARSLDALAARAAEAGLTITIDMEESAYTQRTIDLYVAVHTAHRNLGIALQAYLYRTADDLARLAPLGGHIRLCKGAYDEPDEVAWRHRAEVDASFDQLLDELMRAENLLPAVATHDEDRIVAARRLAERRVAPFEFQMLYGVRGRLQQELIDEGYALRVYVPYGDAWYPYLTRRIAERPSNVWFFIRALFGR
jgi:proline dehydrogenase